MSTDRTRLPAAPLAAWLDERIGKHGALVVAERAGTNERALRRVLDNRGGRVTLDLADRIVTRFDDWTLLEDLWPDLDERMGVAA